VGTPGSPSADRPGRPPAARTAILALVSLFAACQREPEEVFVQGKAFRHVVRVTTDQGDRASVAVGEVLTIHASRSSGPWIARPRSEAPADGCWMTGSAEEHEPQVATSVKWLTEPPGNAVFDIPGASELRGPRKVRFTRAGEYRLQASSAITCSTELSNVILVTVRED
jgi:hypothetical protein